MIAQSITMTQQSQYHVTTEEINTEWELIQAAKADPQQFEPLYKTYYPRIVAFVYQRVDDKDIAYDITSQVFYTALKNLNRYRSLGLPFGAWLYRIALNELNQLFRKNKTQRAVNVDAQGLESLKQAVETNSEQKEADRLLFEALQLLDKEELELVDMRFFEDRSFKEISQITGMGESACKMRVYRILEKLRLKLEKNIF